MTTETNTPDLISLTAEVVSAYVANNAIQAGEVPSLIASVHQALSGLGKPVAEPKPEPIVPIKKTVTPDYLISLEDGKRYKSLKRHLTTRGITPDEYRQKWGLPATYPMTCEAYSKARSELAKTIGLGNMRGQRHPKSHEYTGPKRPRGRPRKLAVVTEAAAVNEAA